MNSRARRILAIALCSLVGTVGVIYGTELMTRGRPLPGVVVLLVAGFLLLSAVGLWNDSRRPPRKRR
jgi:uncharacterized membrane protein YdjX (TVP38/TMEM64 family)